MQENEAANEQKAWEVGGGDIDGLLWNFSPSSAAFFALRCNRVERKQHSAFWHDITGGVQSSGAKKDACGKNLGWQSLSQIGQKNGPSPQIT